MDRVNQIWRHPVYQEHYKKIQELESERIFCRHTPEHFLDVARLMYIYALEEHLELPKELIYAAALLHDIGRYAQYEANLSHHQVGATIGRVLLENNGFSEDEINMICDAIMAHHTIEVDDNNPLKKLLYKADKLSRNCFACCEYDNCYWEADLKNTKIEY